jgi:hypothetical protein
VESLFIVASVILTESPSASSNADSMTIYSPRTPPRRVLPRPMPKLTIGFPNGNVYAVQSGSENAGGTSHKHRLHHTGRNSDRADEPGDEPVERLAIQPGARARSLYAR